MLAVILALSLFITEVSPHPVNGTLEFVEIYVEHYEGQSILIRDLHSSDVVSMTMDPSLYPYTGFILITPHPLAFPSCAYGDTNSPIGNGLSNSADGVEVIMGDLRDAFNYSSTIKGLSYQRCLGCAQWVLAEETPCADLVVAMPGEDPETDDIGHDAGADAPDTGTDANIPAENEQEGSEGAGNEEAVANDEPIDDDGSNSSGSDHPPADVSDEERIEEEVPVHEENDVQDGSGILDGEDTDPSCDHAQEEDVSEEHEEEQGTINDACPVDLRVPGLSTGTIEYFIASKGRAYRYTILDSSGGMIREARDSSTSTKKQFTPKMDTKDAIFILRVEYECAGEMITKESYMLATNPSYTDTSPVCEQSSLPIRKDASIIASFYTRAQKPNDAYNFFFSSRSDDLGVCFYQSLGGTDLRIPHDALKLGNPMLIAWENGRIVDHMFAKVPESILEGLEENNTTMEEDANTPNAMPFATAPSPVANILSSHAQTAPVTIHPTGARYASALDVTYRKALFQMRTSSIPALLPFIAPGALISTVLWRKRRESF